MKSIEFDEDGLKNLQSLADQLFSDCQDPRCQGYHRVLVRPDIPWGKLILHCLGIILLVGALFFLLYQGGIQPIFAAVISVCLFLLCVFLSAKKVLIWLVKIYQRYAPDSIRNKCRFEPSCSQYMLICLEKYGLRKGLIKGLDRLKRCNSDNGGYDEP